MKKIKLDELIEVTLIVWVENTDWEEEKIVNKVATTLEVPVSRVQKIMNKLDF